MGTHRVGSRGVRTLLPVLATSLATLPGVSLDAWAQNRSRERSYETVTAESWSGTGRITAPIRQGQWGHEVRLPGGTWIPCKQDCKTTLREETVDFWDTQSRRGGGSASGEGASGGGGR
jgi:hypothetical protein